MQRETSSDPSNGVRSLRAYNPMVGSWAPATAAQFAELLADDFERSDTVQAADGVPWRLVLDIGHAVGVLRCLDELAAVYAGTRIETVVKLEAQRLRGTLESTRVTAGRA